MVIEPGNSGIGKSGVNSTSGGNTRLRSEAHSSKSAPQPPSQPSDSVSLSSEAQILGRLESQVKAADDVDMGKVEAVRNAIREGRYDVDSHSIADKMLSQDRNF